MTLRPTRAHLSLFALTAALTGCLPTGGGAPTEPDDGAWRGFDLGPDPRDAAPEPDLGLPPPTSVDQFLLPRTWRLKLQYGPTHTERLDFAAEIITDSTTDPWTVDLILQPLNIFCNGQPCQPGDHRNDAPRGEPIRADAPAPVTMTHSPDTPGNYRARFHLHFSHLPLDRADVTHDVRRYLEDLTLHFDLFNYSYYGRGGGATGTLRAVDVIYREFTPPDGRFEVTTDLP